MTWVMLWRNREIVGTLSGFLLVVVLILGSVFSLGLGALKDAKEDLKKAQARAAAAEFALQAFADLKDRSAKTDEEVKDAIDEIRKADPLDRDAVARRELCKLQNNCLL